MKVLFVGLLAVGLLVSFGFTAFSADESLLLYFDFDQGSGKTVTDKSQYGNNGEVMGDIVWVDSMSGYGKCISLPGAGPHINVPDSDSLTPGNAITVEAWVRPEELADPARVVIAHWFSNTGLPPADPQLAWVMEAGGKGEYRAILNWGGGRADSKVALKLNTWQHVAFIWDGSTVTLYLDGAENGSAAFPGPLWNSGEPIQVARTDNDAYTWKGQLDEIKIYKRALSAEEIISSISPSSVKSVSKLATAWGMLKVR